MKVDLSTVSTEGQNKNTMNIDSLSTIDMVKLINKEDEIVNQAVGAASQEIAHAIDAITNTLSNGGRLVYIGAGTSGRLGVLDASEILPTFGVGEEMVIGIIAGGDTALRKPIENAEDSLELAVEDLKKIGFNKNDILCAIASSGRTPYCIGGVNYAKDLGAQSVSISCSSNSALSKIVDYPIELIVGQEVIMGSTRLKSGTATKMVLNMLSTGTMIKLGKVYGNLMVDLKASNQKLIERSKDIIMKATDCTYERASELLELSKLNVKEAIVMELMSVDSITAIELLKNNDGRISSILNP